MDWGQPNLTYRSPSQLLNGSAAAFVLFRIGTFFPFSSFWSVSKIGAKNCQRQPKRRAVPGRGPKSCCSGCWGLLVDPRWFPRVLDHPTMSCCTSEGSSCSDPAAPHVAGNSQCAPHTAHAYTAQTAPILALNQPIGEGDWPLLTCDLLPRTNTCFLSAGTSAELTNFWEEKAALHFCHVGPSSKSRTKFSQRQPLSSTDHLGEGGMPVSHGP